MNEIVLLLGGAQKLCIVDAFGVGQMKCFMKHVAFGME